MLPDSRDEAVDEIILRFLQGRATEVEQARLRRWRRASAENEARFERFERIWAATELADGPPVPLPEAPPAAALLDRFERRRLRAARARRVRRFAPAAGIAAVLATLVFGAPWRAEHGGLVEPDSFAATEFVAGPAESATVTLGDGSVVRIAPGGRLRVMLDTATRTVWLDGKAYFAVASQEGRPFTVHTPAGSARVLGTRFEMKVEDEELRVVVVDGRVALSAAEETVEVGAGEMSRASAGALPTLEPVEDIGAELSWLKGFLAFQATPLDQVAREIEGQYGVRVLLSDPSLGERTVTATFVDRDVEDVLLVICGVVDARCTIRDSVATIDPFIPQQKEAP